jgi:hypothetical protein
VYFCINSISIILQIPDVINTIGVSLILMAFFLLTIRKISSTSLSYHILNMTGAGLACYGSWLIDAVPFMVLEGIWALVACMGLIRNILARRSRGRDLDPEEPTLNDES